MTETTAKIPKAALGPDRVFRTPSTIARRISGSTTTNRIIFAIIMILVSRESRGNSTTGQLLEASGLIPLNFTNSSAVSQTP